MIKSGKCLLIQKVSKALMCSIRPLPSCVLLIDILNKLHLDLMISNHMALFLMTWPNARLDSWGNNLISCTMQSWSCFWKSNEDRYVVISNSRIILLILDFVIYPWLFLACYYTHKFCRTCALYHHLTRLRMIYFCSSSFMILREKSLGN